MTSQVNFDSHVLSLLTTTVGLVNALTPGREGGREVPAPQGRDRTRTVAMVLGRGGPPPRTTAAQAARLAEVAGQARLVFEAADRGDTETAARLVNQLLEATAARPRLDHFPDSGWSLHFHGPDTSLATGWTAGIAAGLALAVGSDLAGRLGVCAASGCDRVYVDTSRNGARSYCSARCQSRVKAAAHRARQRAGRGPRVS